MRLSGVAEVKGRARQIAVERLLAMQASDGALPMGGVSAPQPQRLVPYFASLGAQGLVVASREEKETDRQRRCLEAARRWVFWFDAHRNPDGTIYDFEGSSGTWKATGKYDSTDSYASTYLELLAALHRSDRDTKWLKTRYASVRQAIQAIRLTLQKNDLTTATPKWPVMYTMDNVEVWRGLRAAAYLAQAVGSTSEVRLWSTMADRTRRAIARDLWDRERNSYLVGLQTDGGKMTGGLEKWYPDVMANLLALGWLPATTGEIIRRHRALYQELSAKPISDETLEGLAWWGFAARTMGDSRRLSTIQEALAKNLLSSPSETNPAILGHACRLLSVEEER